MSPDRESALRAIEDRYGALPEKLPSVAYIYEPGLDGRCLYISPSIERVLGYTREKWLGDYAIWDRLVHPDDYPRVTASEAECARSGEALVQEYRLRAADGRWVWIRDEMTVLRGPDDRRDPLFYGVFLDVTDRKRMESELERLALYDALTGLPNRALFTDRLRHALGRRERSTTTAIYFLDVDRFKRINDSLGHGAGDEVLREVARRLKSALRPDDTVARFGGDEFTILCESVGGVLEAVSVADRLQQPLSDPIRAGGADLRLSASIGVALAEAGELPDGARLIENADAAMYRAKERGGARAELFDLGMRERAVEAMTVEQELQRGLGRGELRLFYQPQVSLATGALAGVEALLRWQHPERGLLPPGAFLNVAEESGLIVPLGAWTVQEACARIADWSRREGAPRITVSVNLSARELTHPDIVPMVLGAVRRSGIDPSLLCIEVTESAALADRDSGFRALRELSGEGVLVAIDDFGTGYSCLDQLRQMPADVIKIDRSFVSGLEPGAPDSALVAAVIAMGRALDVQVIAEGIETPEQAAELRELGCPLGQGFLFAEPLLPAEIDAMLEAQLAG
ncbi:MAG TPA: EAL domain-containing protein [Thermoleophilaceae bacterium]|jgi:diguanylate cyclase (GGDEF)-like protein/PAS domain S-box-containing protein|nr:EAL domain-containing protein [Thermoleophilaceae bacterium]